MVGDGVLNGLVSAARWQGHERFERPPLKGRGLLELGQRTDQ
jgi:hypothetical protein